MSYGINNLSSWSLPSDRTPKHGDDTAAVAGTTATMPEVDDDRGGRGKEGEEGEGGRVNWSLIAFLDDEDDTKDDDSDTNESLLLEGSSEEGKIVEGRRVLLAVFCVLHWPEISA